jgi:hypothetical protein
VIPSVTVRLARVALLFDVVHVSIRSELAVSADDAAAPESGKAEKPHKTAHTASAQRFSKFRTYDSTLSTLQRDNDGVNVFELFGTI